jgi:hypothetical protein
MLSEEISGHKDESGRAARSNIETLYAAMPSLDQIASDGDNDALDRAVVTRIVDMINDVSQARSIRETAIHNEQTRQAMESAKEDSDVEQLNGGLFEQLTGVSKAVATTDTDVAALQHEEDAASKSLNGGILGLESARVLGEDYVNEQAKKTQMAIQANSAEDLNGLEAVMGASDSATAKAQEEQARIEAEFQQQLHHFQTASEQQTTALTDQVLRLSRNAPDFPAMFRVDTADSRAEIEAAHDRLLTAGNWTEGVMNAYEGKLDEVRKQREKESAAIHDKVSESKAVVVGEAKKTVDEVTSVNANVEEAVHNMTAEMISFKQRLTSLSATTTEHDQKDVDKLESGMFTMEAMHKRLLDKVSHFFHFDRAFNEEVEEQLRRMGRAIDMDDSGAASEELEQQVVMNSQLDGLKNRFADQVQSMTRDGTKAYSALASTLSDGVAKVLKQQELGDPQKADETKHAQEALGEKAAAQAKIMSMIRDNQNEIERSSGVLDMATMQARNEVESGFLLPKLSSNAENAEVDDKLEKLAYRMKSMGASYLQTGANVTNVTGGPRGAPSSLIQTQQAAIIAASDAAEEQAIAELNAELFRENEKLAAQNSRLKTGLGKAWRYLAQRNVSEAVTYVQAHNATE